MTTTYTNEQVLQWIEEGSLNNEQIQLIEKEPYSDEVFVRGIENGDFWFPRIEKKSDAIAIAGLQRTPWLYHCIDKPSYAVSLEAVKLHPVNLQKVPKDQRTAELCDAAIDSAIEIRKTKKRAEVCKMASVPKSLRTEERLARLMLIDGSALKLVKNNQSEEAITQAIRSTPQSVRQMDLDTLDEKYLILALSLNGKLLKHIPKTRWSDTVIETALKKEPSVIRWIESPTHHQFQLVLEKRPYEIGNVKGSIPMEIYKKALLLSPYSLRHEDRESRVLIPYYVAACCDSKENHSNLQRFQSFEDEEIRSETHFLVARYEGKVSQAMDFSSLCLALSSASECFSSYEEVLAETPYYRQLKPWFQENFFPQWEKNATFSCELTAKERLRLVKEDGLNLGLFYKTTQTPKLIQAAIQSNPLALRYVAPYNKSYRLCRQAIQQNPEAIYFSPYHVEEHVQQQVESLRK